MKTAISLPDDLFALAERYAQEYGLSRSQLYATALRTYLETHRQSELTEKINQACADLDDALPSDVANIARWKLLETEW